MSNVLVSILIPAYNAAPWIAETLGSALAQTHSRCEIIVVDDGSRDDTLAIARALAARHAERIRVETQTNAGASAARNHALRLARGDFIQYLDADDLLSPDKIGAQLALLQSRSISTIASCAWGRFEDDPTRARFVDNDVFRDFTAVEFLVLAGNTGAMMHPASWLVPRTVANRAGPWNESLSLNDDGEYFARVLLASTGIAYCTDCQAKSYYRSGMSGSLSQQRKERARRSQFHSIELITTALLTAENSSCTRSAAANYFQRFIHDFYPAPADLMAKAAQRVIDLGGTTIDSPAMGPKTRLLASIIGWRAVWRLKQLIAR